MNEDLFRYFMNQTNERFNAVDKKLDKLISFRLMLLGGAAVISCIVSIALTVLFH